ncbi:MAG TPA: enoyl-CoA hydratase/isomerase family protein [Tepidiformaceae bacterium]
MADVVRVINEGKVRIVQMNRPELKNALNQELAWGMLGAVEEASKDDSVWVIAVTGVGDAFSSGLDLTGGGSTGSPLTGQAAYLEELAWVGRIPYLFRKMCDKPIVAGINGVAVGAGLGIAMSCDVKLMARNARLIAGYPRIGGSPDAGLSWTLPQAMGYEQAMRFLLENKTVTGDEALKLGMVGEVVDDTAFDARFHEYCQQLTNLSPITSRLTKRGVGRAVAIDLESQLRYEVANIGKAFGSRDGKEARAAFLERRTPVFEGR